MVGEQHRLGPLEVGVPGQVGVARLHGPVQQGVLELDHRRADRQQLPARVEPEVGGDLVVAAPPGVELGPDVAGELGHPAFHRRVDVLVPGLEDEDPRAQLLLHPVERGQQDGGLARSRAPRRAPGPARGRATRQVVGASRRS